MQNITVDGKSFKERSSDKTFFVICNENMENIYTHEGDHNIIFFQLELCDHISNKIISHITSAKYVRLVILPDDAEIKINILAKKQTMPKKYTLVHGGEFCTNKITYSKIYDIWNTEFICLNIVSKMGSALQYVTCQTDIICKTAIKNDTTSFKYVINKNENICKCVLYYDGLSLQYIKFDDRTYNYCILAVTGNGMALQFIDFDTMKFTKIEQKNIINAALESTGLAIQYIKNPTFSMCIKAVTNNGLALEYIKNQTHEICELAVINNGLAIQHVKKQTLEICKRAIEQNTNSAAYMNETMINKLSVRKNRPKWISEVKILKSFFAKISLYC